jgi:hypothetical protein
MDSGNAAEAEVLVDGMFSIRLAKADFLPSNLVCWNPDRRKHRAVPGLKLPLSFLPGESDPGG